MVHEDGIVENQREFLQVILSSSAVTISEPGTILIKIEDSDSKLASMQ